MNIVLGSDIFPGSGGVARYCSEISSVLKKEHNVTILSYLDAKPGKIVRKKIRGINVIRLERERINKFIDQNSDKIDLFIGRTYLYLEAISKINEKALYVVPSLRTAYVENKKGLTKKQGKEIIETEKKGLKKIEKIVFPTKSMKKRTEKEYGLKKGVVIHPGVNLKLFKPCQKKKYDVICVSNFNDARKGIDKLIEAARFSKANFIVLGDGSLRTELEDLIKKYSLGKRFSLIGRKPSHKHINNAKIYVLPSRDEAIGNVLLEAMASGIPCIAFKPDGKKIKTSSDEVIINGKTGFLVKDEKEMSEKIDLLLKDGSLREKMGRQAREQIEKYSWETTAKKILSLV